MPWQIVPIAVLASQIANARFKSKYSPEPKGTLLPDKTRWGALPAGRANFSDPAGIFATTDVELISSGHRWTEGPVWSAADKALYFVDTITARIFQWRKGRTTVVASETGGSGAAEDLFEPGANGLALAGDDVVICQHASRRVIRVKFKELKRLRGRPLDRARCEVLADAAPGGRPLNAPNDVVVASDGDVYFTDPVYGFLEKEGHAYRGAARGLHPDQPYLDEAVRERGAGVTGVYRVRDGAVSLFSSALTRPNGLALSRDEFTLWVADSRREAPSWHAFSPWDEPPVERPATLNETHLGSLRFGPGASDGIKIDEAGRLWATVPGGLAVIDPQTRRALASVALGTNTANLCFGDGGDVFVTGLAHVWRLRRKVQE